MSTGAGSAHRSLDGRQYVLGGPLDLSQPATSIANVAVGGRLHEFTAGIDTLGDDIAGALGIGSYDEEYGFAGGTLHLSRTKTYEPQARLHEDVTLAVWRGTGCSLATQLYGGATSADVLGLLRTVGITEHADGVSLKPDTSAGSYFTQPATVVKRVPGLGLLELQPLTAEHVKTLPSWSGQKTGAGELFRDTLSDGNPYFVLAGERHYLTVVPLGDVALSQVSARVGQLTVRFVG